MKTGRTLSEMAAELDRQAKVKRDFISPTNQLEVKVKRDLSTVGGVSDIALRVNGHGEFPIGNLGHEQVAGRVGVPQKYYDRMRNEAPALLATNVNTWFQREPEKRMVRTLDGHVRGFLSDRYRPLDNYPLAEVVIDTLTKSSMKIDIVSCEITERRMYIKAVTPMIQGEVKKGDLVSAGLAISNSEVGCGSVKVEPLADRLVCGNGLIISEYAMKKYHIGRAGADGDNAFEYFKNETRLADDKAFFLKVRDIVEASFRKDVFAKVIESMKRAANKEITGSIEKAVEVLSDHIGLNEAESGGVLRHLIKGGDLSQWGLVNAVTRTSQDVESYDRATELERLGGTVLELPQSDWKLIAEAA
jgi:hypothetical protein